MGAGKSTVGPLIARGLGFDFIDLDLVIESRTGKTISQIFAESGEAVFRAVEAEALRSCRGAERAVIALGGGAFTFDRNRRLIREIGKSVWLDCPLETCLERVSGDRSRPLLSDDDAVKSLYASRREHYAKADLVIDTQLLSPEEAADRVITLLRSSEVGSRLDHKRLER
ncbi:MAG TPA: shikimate kinase [Blastocatellia bacterium]|nr:shikimate kinase [Blastocatellia bacterium]